ncbi:MAG: transporter substrate-binding domain-containing protein [Anaerolineae bacterium]
MNLIFRVFVITLILISYSTVMVAQNVPLRVAIKPLTPFVTYGENKTYSGFSIELWEELARRMNIQFEYVPLETVQEVLDAVRFGGVDAGIAGISITSERESVLDFSQPMFNSGLKILVADQQSNPGVAVLLQLLTPNLLVLLGAMLVIVIAVGHFVWIFERDNPNFHSAYLPGVGEGIWWAASSLLGGADKMPRSIAGRIGAIIWIVSGIILISLFTADLTATNTIQQLQSNIRGVDDLPGKRIATVQNTTAAQYLDGENIIFTPVDNIEDAYQLLLDERIDAVVYDAPVLQYYANTTGKGRVSVVGSLFDRQDYGIAFPTNSPNRELVDRALLAIFEDGFYDELYTKWFGIS